MLSFLSGTHGAGYVPQEENHRASQDHARRDAREPSDAMTQEQLALQAYEELIAAKKKEVAALTERIEEELNAPAILG